ANDRGNITFQPHDINWSNRGRGRDARSRMKKQINRNVLSRNQAMGGSAGPSQPPKKRMLISEEIRITPRYSPTKNMPNFMPEYSEWKPATNSLSASGRSNGRRRVSATPAM